MTIRNLSKLAINNELQFVYYKKNVNDNYFTDANNYSYSSLKLIFSVIKMNNMIRYKLPVRKPGIYFDFGVSNGLLLISKNVIVKEKAHNSTPQITESEVINGLRTWERSLLLGLMIKYKRISLEGRYEISNNVTKAFGWRPPVLRQYILLAYNLR